MNRETAVFSLTRLSQFVGGVAIALFSLSAWHAHPEDESSLLREALAKKLIAIDTFEASFSQLVIAQTGATEVSQSGRILFDRSGKFLWEVVKPFEQYISVVEDTMRVYDPDLEQLTISAFDSHSQATFASLILTSSTEILEDFKVEFEDNQYTLTPIEQGQDFARLTITFEDDSLSQIEVLDHFNTLNQFRFNDVSTNEPIASDEFELDIPEDTEVIDQRAKPRDSTDQDE